MAGQGARLAAVMVAALLGLLGAWIASGAAGLVGHPLRRGLTAACLGCAVIAAWQAGWRPAQRLRLAVGALAAVVLMASSLSVAHVLAVALVLVVVGQGHSGSRRTVLVLAAEAVTALGLFRLAVTSVPLVWLAADALGGAIGGAAGLAGCEPLWVGATFAGMDFLVIMLYLAIVAPLRFGRFGHFAALGRAVAGVLAVLAGHLVYLLVLSQVAALGTPLPEGEPVEAASDSFYAALAEVVPKLVPWNLPVLAAMIHLGLAWLILRQGRGRAKQQSVEQGKERLPVRLRLSLLVGAAALGVVLPMLTTLSRHRPDLREKRIVVYEKGFLNWLKPEHGDYGRLSIGMYGMLPTYVKSLGADCRISPDLSEADLRNADGLVLLFPDEPWEKDQLERIWDFVRGGGTLLVMGEHTVREEDGGSRINDVLAPTAMRVRFDSATFAIGGWLHSYEALAHPTSAGLTDERNVFGTVIGASVEARWPARPLLVGRWGWADPGDPNSGPSMMGNHRYDPAEKLGDLVLAAEQPLGKGRVIVFGDTSSLTNGLVIGCHPFTSRLLAYVVDGPSGPRRTWRQLVHLALGLLLLTLVVWRPDPGRLAAMALAVGVSLIVCTGLTCRTWEVLPDGNVQSPNNLAYIDASHAGVYSAESWREDGTMGLALTLMRNGYLTLMLPDLSAERLRRARLLVSIAPQRPFSAREKRVLKDFIWDGGIFISTVGYERSGPSRPLLADLGFHVGRRPEQPKEQTGEPEPLGHFKSPFFNGGDYLRYVRFHAAWPVACDDRRALVVTHYPPNIPLIIVRRYGRGLVAVIGDTCFAMNKNLEREDGRPFEGMRENADFWRWFLALLGEGEMWYPPNPDAAAAGEDTHEAAATAAGDESQPSGANAKQAEGP